MRPAWLIGCLACAGLALAQAVEPPVLDEAQLKRLAAGEVLVFERRPTGGRGVAAEAVGVVDAPPAETWPVVRDCEHFSKFLPSTKSSARKQEGNDSLCFDEIALPFPLANLWADTKSVVYEAPGGHARREWSLVRGTYRRNQGAWSVHPFGAGGTRSLVSYRIDSDPSLAVPDFILKSAQAGSLPDVIRGVRKRVLQLRGQAASSAGASP